MNVNKPTRAEMRQGLEKKVLTLALADSYGKFPAKLAMERGITLTPMPNWKVDRTSPASTSCLLSIDHDTYDPSPQKGNLMLSGNDEGKSVIANYTKFSYRFYAHDWHAIRFDEKICSQNQSDYLQWRETASGGAKVHQTVLNPSEHHHEGFILWDGNFADTNAGTNSGRWFLDGYFRYTG